VTQIRVRTGMAAIHWYRDRGNIHPFSEGKSIDTARGCSSAPRIRRIQPWPDRPRRSLRQVFPPRSTGVRIDRL